LEDAEVGRLELTRSDEAQARSKLNETNETVTQRIAETFVHILVPEQTAGTKDIRWHHTKPSGAGTVPERVARKLESEERLITAYSGTRVRMDLDRVPLWTERGDISVDALWMAYCQFPYLPRLARFQVLAEAIADGVSRLVWEQETFAYADTYDDKHWVGLTTAQRVDARPSGLVVRPAEATSQLASSRPVDDAAPSQGDERSATTLAPVGGDLFPAGAPRLYYGQFALDSVRAIRQLDEILGNVVEHLASAPGSNVSITLEVNASAEAFDERTQRVVKENSGQLGAKSSEFE
jgi:hypothetical protein